MFGFIGKIKNGITGTEEEFSPEEEPPLDLDDKGNLWTHMTKKGCPDCRTYPMEYLEGPSGGMSTNIKCAECGSEFNITPAIGIAERI